MRTVVGGVVYGDDARIAAWVQDQLGGGEIAGPYQALGVEDASGSVVFGVIFFSQKEADIEIAMAATDIRPAVPSVMRRICAYPFETLGLPRFSAEIPFSNTRVIRFARGVGLQLEGIKRRADPNGGDVGVFGMLSTECPWWSPRHEGAETARPDQPQRFVFGGPSRADRNGDCSDVAQ